MLTVRDLEVRYPNGAVGVSGVSLDVKEKQVVAVIGPTGAGKTTTMRAISGFLRIEGTRATKGSISFFGTNTTNREPHVMTRMGVAIIPERRKIFPRMSVAENLKALGHRSNRDGDEALERVLDLFPVLKARQRQAAGSLSGGEQQMLAIGRGLLQSPKLLIVDEVTLGLHHSLHRSLFAALVRIASEGTAVLLVDENTSMALDVAEYCYVMRNGRIQDHGPASLFRSAEMLAVGYTGKSASSPRVEKS